MIRGIYLFRSWSSVLKISIYTLHPHYSLFSFKSICVKRAIYVTLCSSFVMLLHSICLSNHSSLLSSISSSSLTNRFKDTKWAVRRLYQNRSGIAHLNTCQFQEVYRAISWTIHSQHLALIFLHKAKVYTRNLNKKVGFISQ